MIEKIMAGISALVLFLVIGVIGYRELGTSKMTVTVQLKRGEDPFRAMKQLLPGDSAISEVREINRINNEYELTVVTHKRKKHLLEWLRSSSNVERVEVKEDVN